MGKVGVGRKERGRKKEAGEERWEGAEPDMRGGRVKKAGETVKGGVEEFWLGAAAPATGCGSSPAAPC
eukprot:6195746-Pleurochrysis_carterae.AAC.1